MPAGRYDVESICPVTTTMVLLIVADAANETRQNGTPPGEITPVQNSSRGHVLRRGHDHGYRVAQRERSPHL